MTYMDKIQTTSKCKVNLSNEHIKLITKIWEFENLFVESEFISEFWMNRKTHFDFHSKKMVFNKFFIFAISGIHQRYLIKFVGPTDPSIVAELTNSSKNKNLQMITEKPRRNFCDGGVNIKTESPANGRVVVLVLKFRNIIQIHLGGNVVSNSI